MLANKLHSFVPKHYTLSLKTIYHLYTSKPLHILDESQHHLGKLYTKLINASPTDISSFLIDTPLPKITDDQQQMLVAENPIEEALQAIKELQTHKHSGPNAFTA